MSIRDLIRRLAGADTVPVPYTVVQSKYSGQMAEIMDQLSKSSASPETKAKPPQKINWLLVCKRAEDPPGITDPEAFRSYLAANSEVYLKAVVDRFIWYEPLGVVPPHFMAQFEQRARWITDHRKQESQAEGAVLSFESHQQPVHNLLQSLEQWLQENRHDRRLAIVARTALEQLLEGEE